MTHYNKRYELKEITDEYLTRTGEWDDEIETVTHEYENKVQLLEGIDYGYNFFLFSQLYMLKHPQEYDRAYDKILVAYEKYLQHRKESKKGEYELIEEFLTDFNK